MWVLFDLNGTLVDPAVLLDPPELPVAALDEANMMAMVTVIGGRDPSLAEGALERLPQMPAFPEVPEALQALRDGGFRLGVLTQSAADSAEAVLANAGLREHFELVLSAPASGAFKPEDLAYNSALEQAGTTEAWFVAGHWWDIAGAAYAGLRTAWISRTDLAYPHALPAPDVSGTDLAAVAAALLKGV